MKKIIILKDGFEFTVFCNKKINSALDAFFVAFKREKNHPIFDNYKKTGIISGFTFNFVGKQPKLRLLEA